MNKKLGLLLLTSASILSLGGCTKKIEGLIDNSTVDFLIDKSDIQENLDRQTYTNVFDDTRIENQWANYGIGDPFVYRFNGKYYLYVSTKNKQVGIRAYKSDDLIHWTPCQGDSLELSYVSNDPCTLGAYAPEVIYWNGKFYMVQSQAGNGHYMLESDSPEGPFIKSQDNFGEYIDGSFFIDDDETMYFLRAGETGIRMVSMTEDMKTSDVTRNIKAANIGGWTEGPYLLKKDGNYFLTFTGNKVTSPGYRIGYAYHDKNNKNSMFARDGFKYGDNMLLCTDDEFNGLGHSSTVLGPNLDSYYIAYHNLESASGPKRRFNVSRLMFNGTEMTCPYYGLEDNLVPEMPIFSASNFEGFTNENGFLLSNSQSENRFSAEYNFKNGAKCIFSYVDSSNYAYVNFTSNNKVEVKQLKNGSESIISTHSMKRTYDLTKLHTFRVAYSNNTLDVYFDTMRVIGDVNVSLNGGKIGYKDYLDNNDIFFTAFSNDAHDSSQNSEAKQAVIPCNTYDEKYSKISTSNIETLETSSISNGNGIIGSKYIKFNGKSVTYKVYAKEAGYYAVDMRLAQSSQGKTVQLRIDNEYYTNFKINSIEENDDDYLTNVGGVAIPKGIHYLTVNGETGLTFRDLVIYKASNKTQTFSNSLSDYLETGAIYLNTWKIKNNGHYALSGNRQLMYVGDNSIRDVEAEVTINLDGESLGNTAGILLRASNPSFALSDNVNSVQGFYVGFNNNQVFITENNYNLSKTGVAAAMKIASNADIKLKAVVSGNTITAYINEQEVLSYVTETGVTHGHVGLYTDGAAATFKNLTIKVNK